MSTDTNPPARSGSSSMVWIVVVVLVVLVAAGGGYWFLKGGHKTTVAAKRPNLTGTLGQTVTELDTTVPDQDKICDVSLKRAADFGAVPIGATLASQEAKAGQPDGTYTCEANTSDGKYTLGIDTNCAGGKDKTCYALDSVKREDGQFTYHRS